MQRKIYILYVFKIPEEITFGKHKFDFSYHYFFQYKLLKWLSKPFRYLWQSLNRTEPSQNLTLWSMDFVSR